jgi:hypothetical protein
VRGDLEADLTQDLLLVEGVADPVDNDLRLHQLRKAEAVDIRKQRMPGKSFAL